MNKIISMVMAAIMLFTTSPILQAAEFTTSLDKAELEALKKEISLNWDVSSKDSNQEYKEIEKRYAEAVKNYKQNLLEFSKDRTEREAKEYKQYIDLLKEEAKKRIENEGADYEGFRSKKEKEEVAFYTVLVEEIDKSQEYEDGIIKQNMGRQIAYTLTGLLVGAGAGFLVFTLFEEFASEAWAGFAAGVAGLGMYVVYIILAQPSKPYFPPTLLPEVRYSKFLEKPFEHLSKFNKGGVNDFELFLVGPDTSKEMMTEILRDAVDIEYYISQDMNVDNMRARMYTKTLNWHNMTTEKRAEYIHGLAEHLRAKYAEQIK